MDFVSIKKLEDYTFTRSTLIAIPDLRLFLTMNDRITPQQVFMSIVKEALKKFDFYYPLFRIPMMYIYPDVNKTFEFHNNFEECIKGVNGLNESNISLIPKAVLGVSCSPDAASGLLMRSFRYQSPYIYDFWYTPSRYWVHMLCNHPVLEEYDELTGEYTDRCGIYFFTWNEDSSFYAFLDQVYVELCRYLLNMKKNLSLDNMPIDIFNGLEEDFSNINSSLENHYSQSYNRAIWLR